MSTVVALSGGVGGAKLAAGLAAVLAPDELTVVCNTGDDFEHLGLPICPDFDTVLYTLAGRANPLQGWGLAGETWNVMQALDAIGAENWFQLGDSDLATHLFRRGRLQAGDSLTDVAMALCERFGVRHAVWPMSDDPVRTVVQLAGDGGELAFQHYFVRDRCAPAIRGFRFEGIATARPQPRLTALLAGRATEAVVICPSNPFVSVDPILSLPGLRNLVAQSAAPVIAVSPIVGGRALKGPAAKMMQELGMPVTARAVATHYGDLLDGFVLDHADAGDAAAIEATGVRVLVTDTVMTEPEKRVALAREVLAFSKQTAKRPPT